MTGKGNCYFTYRKLLSCKEKNIPRGWYAPRQEDNKK